MAASEVKAPETVNNGGRKAPIGRAVDELTRLLRKYTGKHGSVRDQILNDVRQFAISSESELHLQILKHCAISFRFALEHKIKFFDGESESSLYDDRKKRDELKGAFINALQESTSKLDLLTIAKVVSEVVDANTFIYEDENGKPVDRCPFSDDGKPQLPTKNLERLNDYIYDFFNLCRFSGYPYGTPAFWTGKGYTSKPEKICALLADMLKSHHVQKDIKEIKKLRASLVVSDAIGTVDRDRRLLLPCNNGIVHLLEDEESLLNKDWKRTYKILPYSSNIYVTNPLNVNFDPEAYDPDVDEMLNATADYRPELRLVYEEVIGWAVSMSKRFKGGGVFYGDGGGGKSFLIDAISLIIGKENLSHVKLDDMTKDHSLETMLFARANIADELPRGTLSKQLEGLIKDLTAPSITSEQLINKKYIDPASYEVPPLLLFASNSLPCVKEPVARSRLAVVPFLHNFKKDPNRKNAAAIAEILNRPRARSYLLNLGIQGLRRMLLRELANNQDGIIRPNDDNQKEMVFRSYFTRSADMENAFRELEIESTPTIEWIRSKFEDHGISADSNDFSLLTWFSGTLDPIGLAHRTCRYLYDMDYLPFCEKHKDEDNKPLTPEKIGTWKKSVVGYAHAKGVMSFKLRDDCPYVNEKSGKGGTSQFFVLEGNSNYCPDAGRNTVAARSQTN